MASLAMLLLMSGEVTDFGSDEGENGEDDIEILGCS